MELEAGRGARDQLLVRRPPLPGENRLRREFRTLLFFVVHAIRNVSQGGAPCAVGEGDVRDEAPSYMVGDRLFAFEFRSHVVELLVEDATETFRRLDGLQQAARGTERVGVDRRGREHAGPALAHEPQRRLRDRLHERTGGFGRALRQRALHLARSGRTGEQAQAAQERRVFHRPRGDRGGAFLARF